MASPTASVAPRRRGDVPHLHTIRVLAMVGIYLHHLYGGVPGMPATGSMALVFQKLALGVVIFNVLSGFVLAWPHWGPTPAPVPAYAEFLRKRLWRILPAYFLCVLIFPVLTALIYQVGGPWDVAKAMAERFVFLQSLDVDNFMTNIAAWWWLCLLVQFYLVFPPLLRWVRRVGPAMAFGLATLLCWGLEALVLWLPQVAPGVDWGRVGWLGGFNLPFRLPEFLFGVWLAATFDEQKAAQGVWPLSREISLFLGAAVVGWLAGLAWWPDPRPRWVVAFGCYAVLAVGLVIPAVGRMGRLPWVLAFSAASYGIYLVHQPLLSYGDLWLQGVSTWPFFWILVLVGGPICYLAARLLDKGAAKVATLGPGRTTVQKIS